MISFPLLEYLLLSPAVAADRRRREAKAFIVSLEEKSIQLLSVTSVWPFYISQIRIACDNSCAVSCDVTCLYSRQSGNREFVCLTF